MNMLKAMVTEHKDGKWWELRLVELAIVADGATESEMLAQLEYLLTAEYELAVRHGKTPFVGLLREEKAADECKWDEHDDKALRKLNLPEQVRLALATALRRETVGQFQLAPYTRAA